MFESQRDPLAEIFFCDKLGSKEIYCLCSRVFIQKKPEITKLNENCDEQSASDEDQTEREKCSFPEHCDAKQEVDTEVISCYCSASHTDNISTDEHDSLRDSHSTHPIGRGLQFSDSGTDLNECLKHDANLAWHKFWSANGETIIWRSWISKYSDYINPEYMEVGEKDNQKDTEKENVAKTCFSFEEQDLERIEKTAAETLKHSTKKHETTSAKTRMLVRALSGNDSYEKLHTDISEGWNPLSPTSVDFEPEAERLLNSRCGSHASSSFRTQDSMTNVTRMTISSVDLSSKSSDSFSSVSSVQSSLSSSSSEEVEEAAEYEQQWNLLWQKHYEEEYMVQYRKFMCSNGDVETRSEDGGKIGSEDSSTLCGDCHILNTKELESLDSLMTSFTMSGDTLDSDVQHVMHEDIDPETEKMRALGLPVSFGFDKTSEKIQEIPGKKRSHNDVDEDDLAQINKIKAAMSLFGMTYSDEGMRLTGRVEFRKKNIRFQNRQLKLLRGSKNQIMRPKHIYFDDDGNAMPDINEQPNLQLSSSDSMELSQTNSSGEEEELEERLSPQTQETENGLKKRMRKKKPAVPLEIKENPQLMKFWYRRHSLFSKYNLGIKLDKESWYSVTPEEIAKSTAQRCKCSLIIDAFCGAGGNAIQFAFTCDKVIAIDIDPNKIELAKHNAEIYGVADKIEFIVGDFLQLADKFAADVVFLSPPWGGISYANRKCYDPEEDLLPVPFSELYRISNRISKNVAVYLPKNTNTHPLIQAADCKVEIEQNFTGRNLRAITVYYNDLVLNL